MTARKEALLEVRGLSAGYGERVVLEEVSFQVSRGEILVILGRSGAGKSTLLNCLIGLHPPLTGEVLIRGQSLFAAAGRERRAILRQFGVLYQSGALFGSMTVLENVRLPLQEFSDLPPAAQELAAVAKLQLVGLSQAAHKMPDELSGGMQKRAALARALALDPFLLFLDEPSVGLDPITAAGLDELIKQLAASFGVTFVIVTHELSSVYAVASRAILIDGDRRRIVAEGPPAALRDHPPSELVRRFFHREPEPEVVMTST